MKNNFFSRFTKASALAAFMMVAATFSAFANPVEVNKYVLKQFNKQFAQASNVTWKTTSQFTSASFMLNGQKSSVFYDGTNSLICVTKEIFADDLPKPALETISHDYRKYVIKSVIEYIDAEGTMSYYVQLENGKKEVILKSDQYGYLSEFTQ